ncbi:MAG: hypothetical protein H0U73_06695 [Tatlockia sp.]|nr:hypothetical protein [Tatlockia sp.]
MDETGESKMKDDEALDIPNARLLSAAYFALLAVIVTILIDTVIYAIGIKQLIPTYQAVVLAVLFAAGFGALFGEKIIHRPKPYKRKAFLWGFLMVLIALPFYDVVFLYLLNKYHPKMLEGLSFGNIVLAYLFVVLYSFLLAGLWLALAAGFAAMYLRGHVVYDILHSKNDKLKEPHPAERMENKVRTQRILPPK